MRRRLGWALVAVGAILFIGICGEWAALRELTAQEDANHRTLEVQSLSLRGAVARYKHIPFTTAQQTSVQTLLATPADSKVTQRVNHYLEEVNRRVGSDALYLMDENGVTLAASNWNEHLTFVGDNYSFRPYFRDAMQGRSGFFYAIGTSTKIPGLFIATPVRHEDRIIGVVAIKLSLRDIAQAWSNVGAPVYMSDARGIIFLSTVPSWIYTSTRALSQTDLDVIASQQQYGLQSNYPPVPWTTRYTDGDPSYQLVAAIDGTSKKFLAREETLPEFGWTLVVLSDWLPINKARYTAIALATLLTGVLLLGSLYWRQRERRFTEQRNLRRELEVRVRDRTRELGEASAFRKAMEDSLLIGMRARDLEGHIIYVNPALCEMTGYRNDELMGRLPPYPYWHPDDMEQHWRDNEAAMSGQAALTGFESRIRHRDGHDVYTMIYTAPLINGSGEHSGWMSSVVDISEQKNHDARQRQHDEQLQHAQRLASLGEMASTVAHELNQPLMALSNFASAAKAFAEQGKQAMLMNSLDEIVAQAQRAAETVRRIRGFVRQRTQGLEANSVANMIANAKALLKPEIRQRQARIVSHCPKSIPAVVVDRVLLEQVLINLMLNSLQAMQNTHAGEREINIVAEHVNDEVIIQIADNGSGITPDIVDQIFTPFFTTKPDGLGLGLNICHTIVESHGGTLEFKNRSGNGAIFTLKLKCMA
jgi:PAS domain S-box-containing protein